MPAAADVGILLSVGTVGTVSELVNRFEAIISVITDETISGYRYGRD